MFFIISLSLVIDLISITEFDFHRFPILEKTVLQFWALNIYSRSPVWKRSNSHILQAAYHGICICNAEQQYPTHELWQKLHQQTNLTTRFSLQEDHHENQQKLSKKDPHSLYGSVTMQSRTSIIMLPTWHTWATTSSTSESGNWEEISMLIHHYRFTILNTRNRSSIFLKIPVKGNPFPISKIVVVLSIRTIMDITRFSFFFQLL